jgi:hypothetical protein
MKTSRKSEQNIRNTEEMWTSLSIGVEEGIHI